MEAVLDVRLNMPESDVQFFRELAAEKGWSIEAWDDLLQFIESCPKNVPLTDEEILEEVYAVRYGK